MIEERCCIIALKQSGISTTQIAIFINRHSSTVKRWEKRFKKNNGKLQDNLRIGRPSTFTDLIQIKITAFFCQTTPLPGCNSITLKWASEYFNQDLSILGRTISESSISRILRKHSLRPHLHKYFLQITDPDFFEILPTIINLYLNPPKYLFSFDECPGIQALERVAPSIPTGNGKDGGRYSDPNHYRNGTRDLYAFLNVNTGIVFGKCTENHKVETLIQVFKEHVESFPEDSVIHYICDNLSNHSCHEFCRVVAELCSIEYPEKDLDTKKKRQRWLQMDGKRIIIYFTPKHGSWLNMVEIWFGIMGQKCLKHSSFNTVEELAEAIQKFIETWNKYFAHPFNWKYDGKDLYSKAVRRLIIHIAAENKHMGLSFLSGQFELMLNLINKHFKKVKIKYWKMLAKTIQDKRHYLELIIKNSEKPIIKKKTTEIFPVLIDELNKKIQDNS